MPFDSFASLKIQLKLKMYWSMYLFSIAVEQTTTNLSVLNNAHLLSPSSIGQKSRYGMTGVLCLAS